MAGKKSLTDLKQAFAKKPEVPNVLKTAAAPISKPRTATRKPKRVGRPPVAEKRSVKVTLSLTEKEAQVLKSKAGMVPQAAYVISNLHEAGFFDEK